MVDKSETGADIEHDFDEHSEVEQAAQTSEKVQKVLARAGLASRRAIEEWILAGRVRINDRSAHIGDRVEGDDRIFVDGQEVEFELGSEAGRRMVMYHKPEGEVCTRTDPQGRPTVFEKLPRLNGERWVVVGRLDINSTGLLLFTTDGDLANSLMHPSSQVSREYAVRVFGEVTQEMLDNLKRGVMLEDGPARFHSIEDAGGEGLNHWYKVTIKEGKKREVRRMWETQGVQVSRLIRVRFGDLRLPSNLKCGRWVELEKEEIDHLADSVGVKLKKRTGLFGRQKVRAERQNEKTLRRGYLRRRRG
ncbi:MAG TPA: 23S rRNA pseudouridylate synthase B [Gammaproteobacteria bacterium]|nr:pseudouridine synthase [Pseudomonadota bacterium]HBF08038.1 23S rRNA pseudouridylate synthase B [Gammaproteobacteria bacterium]HCK91629.1 23S rRNA pseudouridylate synthase B [Gammaproteobacteria bacterium]|tara:strand:- start:2852 stop:3766 length:915 start_codon:yes stop_codon:yes gene_type:complete